MTVGNRRIASDLNVQYNLHNLTHFIDLSMLNKNMAITEPEFQGLVSAVDRHLTERVHSTELKDKVHSLQEQWDLLLELKDTSGSEF